MDTTEPRAIIKKDITPEESVAINCYSTLITHQIQPHMTYLFPKFKSHLHGGHSGNNVEVISAVEEYLGTRMQTFSMRRLQCSNIAGPIVFMLSGTIFKNSEQLSSLRHLFLERLRTF